MVVEWVLVLVINMKSFEGDFVRDETTLNRTFKTAESCRYYMKTEGRDLSKEYADRSHGYSFYFSKIKCESVLTYEK